jgi:hypothetical protein
MKNSKGISGVVAMVIMIALVMAAVVIVWVVVNNMVRGEVSGAESCFGIFEKVTINERYTCYDSDTNEFRFSISVGDIDVNEVLVAISGQGSTISFKIPKEDTQIDHVSPYNGLPGAAVSLPDKNAGKTYVFNLATGFASTEPDLVELAPIIGTNQCGTSDSLDEIDSCSLLA